MLDNFQKSLSELDTSFGKSSKEVLLHTEAVEKELNKIKGHFLVGKQKPLREPRRYSELILWYWLGKWEY